eukprot:PhF_6_TR9921/c0_g2_i1/m.15105/K03259/EIF4E; translation initiation factor 4E
MTETSTNASSPGPHPLEHKWILWYDFNKNRGAAWEDSLVQVSTFDTVEDFWGTFNNIKRPSSLEFGANYFMFKQGVRPAWEDPQNEHGGKWQFTLSPSDDAKADKAWEQLLLGLVGECVYDGLEGVHPGVETIVTGAVLQRRRANSRISVWVNVSGVETDPMLLAFGRKVRDLMQLNAAEAEYTSHKTQRPPLRL